MPIRTITLFVCAVALLGCTKTEKKILQQGVLANIVIDNQETGVAHKEAAPLEKQMALLLNKQKQASHIVLLLDKQKQLPTELYRMVDLWEKDHDKKVTICFRNKKLKCHNNHNVVQPVWGALGIFSDLTQINKKITTDVIIVWAGMYTFTSYQMSDVKILSHGLPPIIIHCHSRYGEGCEPIPKALAMATKGGYIVPAPR